MSTIVHDVVYQEHYRARIAAALRVEVEEALKQFSVNLIETYPPGSRERDTVIAAVLKAAEGCGPDTPAPVAQDALRVL